MTAAELRNAAEEPGHIGAPARALWLEARGRWDEAHRLVQDDPSPEAAWVHAYLHRKEGDVGNAGYWYARAGRPHFRGPLEAEWAEISASLLRADG